jgi:uncharacterized membrane protein
MSDRIQNKSWRLTFLAAVVVMATSINVAQAKNIKKQNLVELLTHSDSIVVGTVTSTTDGIQDGLPYTEVTILVAQNIKGNHESTYTFRQFGLKSPRANGNGQVNLMVTPAGWPTYGDGESVMLFLHRPAAKTGFQTTAGLTQGKFVIRGDQIANGIDNDELFARVRVSGPLTKTQQDLVNQPGGSYAAQAFIDLVRTIVEESWIETGVLSNAQK